MNNRYDFSDIEDTLLAIKGNPNASNLKALQIELNKYYKDAICKEILYTNNTDKLFFGMCVMPVVSGDMAVNIMVNNDTIRITEYYLELDSRLFNPILNLSSKELTAIILHEIGHLVADSTPVEELRKYIDAYISNTGDNLKLSDSQQYKYILSFGIKDALIKLTSIFIRSDEEMIADFNSVYNGYGPYLESALLKIKSKSTQLNKNVSNKLVVLQWTLRLYKDVKFKRISALHTIEKCKKSTGSRLVVRDMDMVSRNLKQIDDSSLIKEDYKLFTEKFTLFQNFKRKGIRAYEDDLYEYNIRYKTSDLEVDALVLLRQINSRIAIIEDYLNDEDLSEQERIRTQKLLAGFMELRSKLSNKDVVKYKYNSLWVQTPEIKQRTML